MSDTLAAIIEYKRGIITERKRHITFGELDEAARAASPTRGFEAALRTKINNGTPALIAELKKASPSKGLIREDFEPKALAHAYQAGGAACLSVLTDEWYFKGSDAYLQEAHTHCPLPILRKDFMIDTYQITESAALGADCILLIMAALSDAQAKELENAAMHYGMDVLIESHDETELERALTHLQSPLIGINNRNLKTLEVSLKNGIELAKHIPSEKLAICESGISTHADIQTMRQHDMHCFLVGESLMRQHDVETATRTLLGNAA